IKGVRQAASWKLGCLFAGSWLDSVRLEEPVQERIVDPGEQEDHPCSTAEPGFPCRNPARERLYVNACRQHDRGHDQWKRGPDGEGGRMERPRRALDGCGDHVAEEEQGQRGAEGE